MGCPATSWYCLGMGVPARLPVPAQGIKAWKRGVLGVIGMDLDCRSVASAPTWLDGAQTFVGAEATDLLNFFALAGIREQEIAPTNAQHRDDMPASLMPLSTQGAIPHRFYND